MITSRDRAVQLIGVAMGQIWGDDAPYWAGGIVAELADAGLLAPDLPEPVKRPFRGHPHAYDCWEVGLTEVSIEDDEVRIDDMDSHKEPEYLPMEDAPALALAVLAAHTRWKENR